MTGTDPDSSSSATTPTAPSTAQTTITVARGRSTIEVPNVVGLSGVQALTRLQAVGLKGAASSIASQEPKGRVLRQTPASGAQADQGTTVLLTLSKGRVLVKVSQLIASFFSVSRFSFPS